jgi:hypothetical protein
MNRIPASPLIERALEIAEKLTGMERLSQRLGAPDTTIRAWRFGHATMPEHKFLRLVDLLAELDPNAIEDLKKS